MTNLDPTNQVKQVEQKAVATANSWWSQAVAAVVAHPKTTLAVLAGVSVLVFLLS